jgi:adenine deaminase
MGLENKKTQKLTRRELLDVLEVAKSNLPADLKITNVKILDLVNGDITESVIVIKNKTIAGIGLDYQDASALKVIDAQGAVAVPGFIDGHLHIESSMMNPFEFEKMTLPLGTTTAICDPHEITNVLGEEGFSWFLRSSELVNQNLFIQASSCVPALPGFETNGGEFTITQMKKYKEHPNVLGLAEMMNFPGVINGDQKVHDKIEEFSDLNLDGHCPMLRGKDLNAYLAAGIQNCHETVGKEEGYEKLAKGMALIIREGSVAKNLKTLIPLVNDFNSIQCLLCTDDRNPFEIFHEGHINFLLKEMMNKYNVQPHVAYRLSSYSAAKHFGLKKLGLIAPGKQADIVLVSDLKKVSIQKVIMAGVDVAELNLKGTTEAKLIKSNPPIKNTINRLMLSIKDLDFSFKPGKYNVIEIVENEIITKHLVTDHDGKNFSHDDILFMANIERYGKNLPPAKALVRGMKIKNGAIGASVAHDSHNLIIIGDNVADMILAANALIKSGGGLVVIKNHQVDALLELPIAGLMSNKSSEELILEIQILRQSYKSIGIEISEPFIQMAFLALPVIPTLKLTDHGLFDVTKFKYIDLMVN